MMMNSSDRTQTTAPFSQCTSTTHHTSASTGSATTSITAPFHLAVDESGMSIPVLHANHNNNKQQLRQHHEDGDTYSVSSKYSFATTTDGIDVLEGEDAPKNFKQWSQLKAARIVSTVLFKRSVLFLIMVCTVLLGVRTIDKVRDSSRSLGAINLTLQILLIVFTGEMIVSVAFYQEKLLQTTTSTSTTNAGAGWLTADLVLVTIAWWTHDPSVLVLRSFRLLRALRKATGVPSLQWAVKAVLRVLPRLSAVILVLLPGMFGIFAILFTNLYQDAYGQDADRPLTENYFGSIGVALLTLFQIMTLGRNWSVVSTELQQLYPSAWAPLVLFVVVSLFFFASLIVAVMCDAVAKVNRDRMWKSLDQHHAPQDSNCNSMLYPHQEEHHTIVDPTVMQTNQNQQQAEAVSKLEVSRLERKLDDLATTVDTLVRLQSSLQESVNSLVQQELMLQRSNSSSAAAAAATSTTKKKPVLSTAQSGDL